MTIDPDVLAIAHDFGIAPELIQAVVNAEGDIVKAVHVSVSSVHDRTTAIDVTCRSAVHAMSDWVKQDPQRLKDFVAFWGARWAPIGVANDPTNLNANWVLNVTTMWEHA